MTELVKVEGLAELQKAFKQLPKELGEKYLRSAVNAGAKVVQMRARELAPVKSGRLRRAIYRKFRKDLSNIVQTFFVVGALSGKKYQRRDIDAYYWWWLEFGTAKMRARPFLRKAFDEAGRAAVDAIKDRLAKYVEKAADTVKWKT